MLEKYGKIKALADVLIISGLLYIAMTTGGLFIVAALVLHSAWVVYKLYKANAAVQADRVETAYAEQIRKNPSIYTTDYSSQPYTGGYQSQAAPQAVPQPTTAINNTSSSTTGDIALGMAIGSMLSNHGTNTSTTVHHVYEQAPKQFNDEPTTLAPITSEQLDSGYAERPYSKSTERYGEALAPITSEELDNSSPSSSSWGSSSSSSDSSSSSSDSSLSSSSSSSDSSWSSSSSYDSGSSSSSSDW